MNILAIVGSARKGKATDTLVDKAIEGLLSKDKNKAKIKKINLHDYTIKFCKDCLTCRDTQSDAPFVDCILKDDMRDLSKLLYESDAIIFGSPLHMGHVPGIVMTFLERICWTFSKPEASYVTVKGCPAPRGEKKRKAIIIIPNSIVPPLYRKFCDTATATIRGVLRDTVNTKTVGDLYAGNLEARGVECYLDKAYKLGQKLYLSSVK
mgnify:CR=1 FL=1